MNTNNLVTTNKPRSSLSTTICAKKQFVDEDTKYPQYENLYYITISQKGQKQLKLMNLSLIKWCLRHNKYIYEMYKDSQINSLNFDFDHFPTIETFHDMIMCFNEIINDSTINGYYKQLSNQAYPIIDIFAYGKYSKEEIQQLYENDDLHEDLHIHYEEKTDDQVEKSLSAHVVINCYVLHAILDKNLFINTKTLYLTNSEHTIYFDLDHTIYKNNGCLRIASSDKLVDVKDDKGRIIEKDKRIYTHLNITDDEQFKRQFYQYPYKLTDDDKNIYENIFNHFLNTYIRKSKEQAVDESVDDEMEKIINEPIDVNDDDIKYQPIVNDNWLLLDDDADNNILNNTTNNQAIDEPQTELKEIKGDDTINEVDFLKPPLGLIAEILTHYPACHYPEFICSGDNRDWEAFTGFILNSPYTYDELHDVIYEYWNARIKHNNPTGLNDVVYNMMKGKKPKRSNKGFYSLLSIFKLEIKFDDFAIKREFNLPRYKELKGKNKRNLSKDQRKELFALENQHSVIETEYNQLNKYAQQLEKFTRIFKIFQTFELKLNDNSKFNIFIDKRTGDYIHKGEHDIGDFTKLADEKVRRLYPNYELNDIIKTSYEEYKLLKTQYLYSTQEELVKGLEIEECLKSTFENEFDYRMFCDFLRFKLNNVKQPYRINFLFVGDQNSLKTTFMDIVDYFIDVKKGNAKEMGDKFNAVYESDIVLYEEMCTTLNNVKQTVDFLKAQTCAKNIHIEKKGQDIKTIKNHANIVITTNHYNLGGLFDYQENREMFKRFYIIKRIEATEETINKLFKLIDNEKYLNAFIYILKHKEPLTPEEWKNRDTQQQYYNFVKDKSSTRRVLNEYEIADTVRKDNDKGRLYARLSILTKQLSKYNLTINQQTERQQLVTDGIIKYYKSNNTCLILDIYRYYKRYFEPQTKQDNKTIKDHIKNSHKVNVNIPDEDNEEDEEVELNYTDEEIKPLTNDRV